MSAATNLKEAYRLEVKRSPIIKRLSRRDRTSIVSLVILAGCCCLLLAALCFQDAFDYKSVGSDPKVHLVPERKQHTSSNSSNGASIAIDGSNATDVSLHGPELPQNESVSEGDGFGCKKSRAYVEVLGNGHKPQHLEASSSEYRKAGSKAEASEESKMILANNKAVKQYTAEPVDGSLLILTPVKNNAKHLARYFALVDKLKYPREKISIAFLVSDSTDETQQMLIESRKWYQEQAPEEMRFKRFEIYRQDFFFALPRSQRHLRERQRERRIMMARARNYLWTRALGNEQWVLWIDGDLEYYPPNIVRDLMAYSKDVIVPNCLVRKKGSQDQWRHTVYDRNAWQETKESLEMISRLKEDDFLVEGYESLNTHRKYLDSFSRNETLVPLDGVGGTFTLVKAQVHRSGVGFPAWLFQHQVETEGFAKLAKANGFGVYGLPFYYIRHVVG